MIEKLELSGSLSSNLRGAVTSATRLRGHPLHADTFQFWLALLAEARAQERNLPSAEHEEVRSLMGELQTELTARN
jgi:hypothetical protein